VDAATVRRWAVRGLVVLTAAPAVYAVAVALQGRPEPAGIWVAGLAAAVVTTAGAGLVLVRTGDESS
jgi:hypothetical protein